MLNFSSILIVTYGRSGSTLLQGLLNSIEGCTVRGENYNFCYGLFDAYRSIAKTRYDFGRGNASLQATSPWYGAALLDEEQFFADARKLVTNQLAAEPGKDACIGFKEIRYLGLRGGEGELRGYLYFLEKVFPRPALLFLTRDHAQVKKSAWWQTKDESQVEQMLTRFEREAASYAEGKSNVFTLDYSDMVQRSPRLKAMFDFLGAPYQEATIEKVLATRHSYKLKPGVVAARKQQDQPPVENLGNSGFMVERAANSDVILKTKLDVFPEHAKREKLNFGGVVAVNSRDEAVGELWAVDSAGEHRVTWGIESPTIAGEFPGNPGAARARFKVAGLKIDPANPVRIYLQQADGNRTPLFVISLREKSPLC